MILESEILSKVSMDEFENWFNDNIGTDYEINKTDTDKYYIVMGDIEDEEEWKLISNKLNGKVYIL